MRGFIEYTNEHDGTLYHAADKRDLDLIADHCKALRSIGATKNTQGDWHCMTADAFTIQKWCDVRGITFREFFQDPKHGEHFINDPDNAAFRVHEGRI